jgi:hypothetical protein
MFGPNRAKMTGGWRQSHNEELSKNIIRMIKLMRMRLARSVARMGN